MKNENNPNKKININIKSNTWIIGAVALVAIITLLLVFMINQKDPKKVMESFVNTLSTGDIDAFIQNVDVKGIKAWDNCNGDKDKFLDEYNKISDEDAKNDEESVKNSLKTLSQYFRVSGDLNMNITKIEEPENLGNNLFRVKATVHIKATVWGTTNEVDKEFKIIVYNGKFIYPEDL